MSEDGHPPWDDEKAQELVGGRVLIGLTRVKGDTVEQEQMFGVIMSADERMGFEVRLEGSRSGETYRLPPAPENIDPAEPGDYRLRSTGEVVTDPDYTSFWTIEPPPN